MFIPYIMLTSKGNSSLRQVIILGQCDAPMVKFQVYLLHNGSFKRVEILFVKNIKVVCMWYIRLVYFLSMVFVCEFLWPSMGRPLVSKASCEGLPGEGRGDGGACLTAHYNSVRRFCSLCNSSQSKTFHKSYKQTRSDPGSFSLTREHNA